MSAAHGALCHRGGGQDGTEERSDFLSKIVHFISAATGTAAAAAGYGGCETWLATDINNGTGRILFKPKRSHETRRKEEADI